MERTLFLVQNLGYLPPRIVNIIINTMIPTPHRTAATKVSNAIFGIININVIRPSGIHVRTHETNPGP